MHGPDAVLRQARVHLRVHLLPVVLGPEGRKHQVAVGEDLPQAGDVPDGGAVRPDPDDLRRGVAPRAALDHDARGVGEVHAVGGLAHEHGPGGVVGREGDGEERHAQEVLQHGGRRDGLRGWRMCGAYTETLEKKKCLFYNKNAQENDASLY